MTDIETRKYLLKWREDQDIMPFSWPTDACGYDQHIKFVRYRNDNWDEYFFIRQKQNPLALPQKEFVNFVRDYAENLVKTDTYK